MNLSDIEFVPGPPTELRLSDQITQTIAWLTAATRHDRRLLRCNNQGALLVGNSWDILAVVETDELYPQSASPDSFTKSVDNIGVLVTTSDEMVKAVFVRVSGGDSETIYISREAMYWYGHETYSVTLSVVPDPNGIANYCGITAFI